MGSIPDQEVSTNWGAAKPEVAQLLSLRSGAWEPQLGKPEQPRVCDKEVAPVRNSAASPRAVPALLAQREKACAAAKTQFTQKISR